MLQAAQHIRVAIYGERRTGKKTVASGLHGFKFYRSQDRHTFEFEVVSSTEDMPPVQVALVLVDATTCDLPDSLMITVKGKAQHRCVVFTKCDLVAQDYSSTHLRLLRAPRFLSCRHDVDCILMAKKDGIKKLVSELVDRLIPLPKPSASGPWNILNGLGESAIDLIASLFALPFASEPLPNVDNELAAVSTDLDVENLVQGTASWDEELKKRLKAEYAWSVGAHRITPSLLVKTDARPSERASMEFVRQHTSIPIPRIHHPHLSYLLMDYIDGDMLSECWGRQSFFMQFRIACTLRLYVKQLRALQRPTLGSVDSGRVSGMFFEFEEYGPFSTVRRFRQFCDWVSVTGWESTMMARRNAGMPISPLPPCLGDFTPTFIHGDLNASNIMLDKRGTLWLIDWDSAGFYPKCLESLAMHSISIEGMPRSWTRYMRFIAGTPTTEEMDYWVHLQTAIHRFHSYAVTN
ncbi:kinase-like domain-containing protein [Trametes polyzona]|nr:kinase-like domain-containing protein [Trametes polyzona]